MKKLFLAALFTLLLFSGANAQMFGTYNVPGTFPTLAAAIASLNVGGVGGPITINVSAGYTEIAPVGGYTLSALSGATSINTVTIRKSGAGANPVLTAYVGTATPASAIQDGVFRFVGTDWVTIDGIDIADNNTTNPSTMEFGYGFFKLSATDGCQNNTIRNCVISLKTVNNAAGSGPAVEGSRGIDMVNALTASHTTALTITNATGTHSNNKIYNNVIQNCNVCISIIGFAAASPYTLADTGNDIGGSSSVTSNTIINFGGGGTTSAASGIIAQAQHSLNVSYNLVNNNNGAGVNHNQVLRGIVLNAANSAQGSINNNTITLKSAGTTQQMVAISNAAGTSPSNTLTISNNLISGCTYSTATTGVFNAIINSGTPSDLVINSNTIITTNHAGTGTDVIIESGSPTSAITNSNVVTSYTRTGASGAVRIIKTTSPTNWTANANLIDGVIWTTTTSSGAISGLYSLSSAVNVTFIGNNIRNIALPASGTLEGIREFGLTGLKTIQSNTVSNFITSAGGSAESAFVGISVSTGTIIMSGNQVYSLSITGGAAGSVTGILVSGGTLSSIFKNKIYDLSSTSTGPTMIGINITGGTTNTIFNNLVGNLNVTTATGANAVTGINITSGTTNQIFYNTVYLSSTSLGANFGSSALFANTSAGLDLRNNILVNNSSVSGTGLAVAFKRSSTTLTSYSTTSNNNLLYAGVPAANRLVFSDGSNLVQSLASYKALVFNRDANAVTENPPIASTLGSATNFLSIATSNPTQVESGAIPISGITDDYVGTTRNATTPDIGAWEGTYTNMLSCSGSPAAATAFATQSVLCPGVPFNAYTSTTYTESGITFQWQASTTSSTSGFSSITGGTTAILVNPTLTAASNWYQLQITCTSTGSITISSPVLVAVVLPTVSANSNTTFVCGTGSINLSLSTSPTGAGYQWLSSTTGSASGFSAISGATLATRSQSGSIGTNWYMAVVTCSANPTFSVLSNPLSLTVGAIPTAAAFGPTVQLCLSSSVALTATTDIGTGFSWSGPNAFSASTQSVLLPVAVAGAYSFVATLGNCSSAPSVVNVLSAGRIFTNNIVATPTAVCQTGSVTLSFPNTNDPYTFSTGSGLPLLTLTAPSTVLTTNNDDTPTAAPVNIGFTFNFFGTNYTQYSASPDGWLLLGATVGSAQFSNLVTSTTNIPKIYPYWDDLATGTNGYVRTSLLGSTPNRTFVVEWFVTIPRNTAGAANSTFQLLLFETTNQIQFRYGAMGANTTNSSGGLTVSGTNFSSITFSTASTSTITANDNNYTMPNTGTGYIFTAPLNPTYSWSPAANLSSTTASLVTATLTASQVYSLDLNVQGCISTKTVSIIVSTPPVVTASASSPTLCAGGTVTLTANGATSYVWNTGSTNSVAVVTPSLNNNTTYTVTGTSGVCSATQIVSVNRFAGPSITISGPTGICPPDIATLTASGALSYTWNTGANSNSIVVSPTVPTQYTISGTDASGCVNSIVNNLNVNSSLALNGTAPATVCAGLPANIAINGANTYSWSTGATTSSIAPTPTITTTYSVVGTSGSCTGSIAVTVSAIPFPTLTVTGSTIICAGQTTTLNVSGATTYSWATGSLNNSITAAPLTNTTYVMTGFNGLCGTTRTISVTSNTLPVITITQASASVCFSTAATFTATGANSYSWINGPATNTFVATPTVNTTYSVVGTSVAGCTATQTILQSIIALPVLSIAPATPTLCLNVPTSFTASGATTYTWNGGAATGSNPALAASTNTVFSVVGANASGCVNTATVAITTIAVPTVVVSPSNVTVCSTSPVSFTASGATSYVWFDNSTNSVVLAASANSTVYNVIGTGTNGCPGTGTMAITTLTLPIIAVNPPSLTACALSPNTFTANGAVTYTWSNGANSSTAVITPTGSSLYNVTGTNPEGCSSQALITIITYPLPVLTIAKPAFSVCPNSTGNYTVNGADTYSWSTGTNGNVTPITPTSTAVYSVSGTNTITSCVATQTFAVLTYSLPVITVTPSTSQTICVNSNAIFTAGGALTFTWTNGTQGNILNVSPSVNTSYTVNGKNQIGCIGSKSVSVSLYSLTVVTASATSATVCAKNSVTMTATGALTYTWLPYNVTGATYTIIPTGTLKYTLQGTDINGCVAQDTIKVTVDKCTGINENNRGSLNVQLFPNPSSGRFSIEMPFEGIKNIRVMSSTGALVYSGSTQLEVENVNLGEISKGIYFVSVEAGGITEHYRIIIQQ